MTKQILSPAARRAKAARDKAAAMTPERKRKKAENQRRARANPSAAKGKDWDHKDKRWETPAQNRGNDGQGTKKEGNKNY
jgi:hypothetical protein